jgi:hypothetical protein
MATAFHEAGHISAFLALQGEAPFAELLDGPDLFGLTVLLDPPTRGSRQGGGVRRAACDARTEWWVSLAGPAAERRYVGRASPCGYSASDMRDARRHAALLVTSLRSRAAWWKREWRRVLQFIDANWAQISALARALHARGSLLPSEVLAVVAPYPAVRAPAGWFF